MRTPVAILLLGAGLLAAGCGDAPPGAPSASAKPAPAPAPPPFARVETVAPEYRRRDTALETSGKIQFNEERLTRVQAPVTGRVIEVLARPGDVVEPGRRLLVIDSPDLGAAKADYAKAVSDSERADAARKLARDLFEVKAIAQKEVRDAENDDRKAVAERERAASRLRTLGVPESHFKDVAVRADTLTRIVVTAPRSGVIVERNANPGQVVAYGQSDTPVNLFVIADLGTMWVQADVYEPDVPRVRLGQAVTVTLPCCPGERYEGRVTYISDAVDPQSRTVKVRAAVPNRGRTLKAEMFVKVAIATGAARVLAVPQSAVHREDGQTFLLVQHGPSEFHRQRVTLGADLDGFVEVKAGVGPEDRVAATGSILLKKAAR
ncbi:MAG: efflux RND transporter periplasmic adaptor subunit [Candidatus Rokubacteria bacterium]|nr:efflux RND transporter periplasmic adaptor subunit [Candidatus Rokubacteria bacterium]